MSDILASSSSSTFNRWSSKDNLVEFLTKLARFGVNQCLHFVHLIGTQQRSLHSNRIHRDQRNDLNHLLLETQTLQKEFSNTLELISSADDQTQQLLFVQLQKYLSDFLQINLRFKSLDFSTENSRPKPLESPKERDDRNLSITSSISNLPQIIVSSSSDYNDDTFNNIDIGKSWKFANIVHTRFEISSFASDSHLIICYNNQNHYLNLILSTGQFQGCLRWNYESIIAILWCGVIDCYVVVTQQSVYTIQYKRLNSSNSVLVNKVLDLERFHSTRIACNQNNILLYKSDQQSSVIQIYDDQFNRKKSFDSRINEQLPINSPSFCCTNTLIALTDRDGLLIPCFPYVTPKKKISLLLFDIDTFVLRYTIDLNDCSHIYTMKCLEQHKIFFALSDEKILWIIQIDDKETIHMAKKTFYTNQTDMCVINNRDLLLINVNAGHAIQLIKYRTIKE